MKQKVTGTLILDGMIEGKIPFESEDLIKEWVNFTAKQHLFFDFQNDGGSFNILADNRPIDVNQLKEDPSLLIKKLLEELVKIFPNEQKASLFSTIRSVEYITGNEIQTLYAITPDGNVTIKTRELAAETVEREKPLSKKNKIALGLSSAALILILLILSSFLIDYKKMFKDLQQSMISIKTEELKIENRFYPYFRVLSREKGTGDTIMITIQRSTLYPLSENELNALYEEKNSLTEKLILEAIARKNLQCEYYDAEGNFIYSTKIRFDKLTQEETLSKLLPYDKKNKPSLLILTY